MKRERHLKMFEGICEGSNTKPITEPFGIGFTTYFVWNKGNVTQGHGVTEEESIEDFENAICEKYELWGL